MLNGELILRDAQGRLRTTLETPPPLDFNGGTPVKDGLLSLVYVDGQYYVNGLGYGLQLGLSSEQEITPEGVGLMLSPRGRLRSSNEAPMFWLYSLPFTADGQLSIAPPEGGLPAEPSAFSLAFSSDFD